MDQEVKLFTDLIYLRKGVFESNGYFFEEEKVYNEGTDMEFFQILFSNVILDKGIIFSFSPSTKKIGGNEISASIRKKNGEGIGIIVFLAYQELHRRIAYEDWQKYRFKVDPQNLEETINQQLDRIIEILNTDMKELFTTEAWMSIPQVHPFDD